MKKSYEVNMSISLLSDGAVGLLGSWSFRLKRSSMVWILKVECGCTILSFAHCVKLLTGFAIIFCIFRRYGRFTLAKM